MIVKTILKTKARGAGVVTIDPEATIADAARLLANHRIGAVIAIDANGAIKGILSERDIVRGLAQSDAACTQAKVSDLMTATVLTCHEDDSVDSLMKTMTAKRIRHLPVVGNGGELTGMVTIGDVVKSRLDEMDMEVDNLRQYVAAAR
ncbi:MAG: CBS domain-containing protein [Magnetospirillum sp.]|nr:CBS domain-containing protein [Magnetospirillum sp.]